MSSGAGASAAGSIAHAGPAGDLTVSAERLRLQLEALFAAWSGPDHAQASAEVLVEADLMGIDSHGVTLVQLYEELVGEGKIVRDARLSVARGFGAVAVVDGGRGLRPRALPARDGSRHREGPRLRRRRGGGCAIPTISARPASMRCGLRGRG